MNLVSVIIPTINYSFIEKSIKSILNQQGVDIEVIIVDDSLDNKIIQVISDINDCRIKYFKGKHQGIAAALNFGIEHASGNYIARMDDDDVAVDNRFYKQINYLLENNLDICGSNIRIIDTNKIIVYPEYHQQISFSLNFYCSIAHPTVLAKASFFKENKYNINDFYEEDYKLWIKTKDKYLFGNIQEPLLHYRIHSNQASKFIENSVLGNMACNYNLISIKERIVGLKITNNIIRENIYYYYLINNKTYFPAALYHCGIKVVFKIIYRKYAKNIFRTLFK